MEEADERVSNVMEEAEGQSTDERVSNVLIILGGNYIHIVCVYRGHGPMPKSTLISNTWLATHTPA